MCVLVFTLPFQQFLVHLDAGGPRRAVLVTALSHYLNGGIRMQGRGPDRPAVKAPCR